MKKIGFKSTDQEEPIRIPSEDSSPIKIWRTLKKIREQYKQVQLEARERTLESDIINMIGEMIHKSEDRKKKLGKFVSLTNAAMRA